MSKGDMAPDWLIRRVTVGWGLPPERTRLKLISVSENATFRVEIDGSPYAVLRVHRPGYVEPEQIRSKLQWVRALGNDMDVRVPSVLPLVDDSLVLTFGRSEAEGAAAAEAPWHVVAFAFIQGEVLEDIIDTLQDPASYYRRIGATTAVFHDHQQEWLRPQGFGRFQWGIADMLGESSRWGDWRGAQLTGTQFTVLPQAEERALEQVSGLEPGGAGWGLIHADLRPSNIMIHDDTLTVIDFDDCGYGWLLYDLASAFSFIEHEPYAPRIAKEWLKGYQEVRELSDKEIGHACALSMLRGLTMLGWTITHREDALPPAIWAAQVPGTVNVANQYLCSSVWIIE